MSSSLPHERSKRIALLNDAFRLTFIDGLICVTAGLQTLGPDFVQEALRQVRRHDRFDPDNDPYGEHDFGSITVEGQKLFWKIDYYAPDMIHGSQDPANREITRRVLTVMLAEEY